VKKFENLKMWVNVWECENEGTFDWIYSMDDVEDMMFSIVLQHRPTL